LALALCGHKHKTHDILNEVHNSIRSKLPYLVDSGLVLNNIESNSLGERSALADSDNITLTDVAEGGGAMNRQVAMSLLESSVLGDVVEVVSADDDGSLHLVGDNQALQDTTTDRHVASEGAPVARNENSSSPTDSISSYTSKSTHFLST
jgi:hypothetical protein